MASPSKKETVIIDLDDFPDSSDCTPTNVGDNNGQSTEVIDLDTPTSSPKNTPPRSVAVDVAGPSHGGSASKRPADDTNNHLFDDCNEPPKKQLITDTPVTAAPASNAPPPVEPIPSPESSWMRSDSGSYPTNDATDTSNMSGDHPMRRGLREEQEIAGIRDPNFSRSSEDTEVLGYASDEDDYSSLGGGNDSSDLSDIVIDWYVTDDELDDEEMDEEDEEDEEEEEDDGDDDGDEM